MDSETTISRRKLLRNLGLAGGAVWAAPVLTSLGTPAAASTRGKHNKSCVKVVLGDPSNGACGVCNVGSCDCEGRTDCSCFCVVNIKGCCFCTESTSCSSLVACPGGQSQCPSGFSCVPQTCCGTGQVCVPGCGAGLGVRPKRGERTTAPR